VSLEVAEHLPPESAELFADNLSQSPPFAMLSAAIPGQGGLGRLNERWPSYWAALFEQYGSRVTGWLRWVVWDDERVEPWYRQNPSARVRPAGRHGPDGMGIRHAASCCGPSGDLRLAATDVSRFAGAPVPFMISSDRAP
jgi:hypothetical protein